MIKIKFKCYTCSIIFDAQDIINGKCPICHDTAIEMCAADPGICHCANTIHESIHICPKCNQPMCPECQSHDVVAVSRVTGYLQDVSGFNNGKLAELKDRHRINNITETFDNPGKRNIIT